MAGSSPLSTICIVFTLDIVSLQLVVIRSALQRCTLLLRHPTSVSFLHEGEPPPPRSTPWGAYRTTSLCGVESHFLPTMCSTDENYQLYLIIVLTYHSFIFSLEIISLLVWYALNKTYAPCNKMQSHVKLYLDQKSFMNIWPLLIWIKMRLIRLHLFYQKQKVQTHKLLIISQKS